MPRISKQELAEATLSQKTPKNKQEKEHRDTSRFNASYTLLGKHERLDDDGYPVTTVVKNTYAKKVILPSGHFDYYVMVGPEGRLFNPYGLLSSSYQAGRQSIKGRSDYQLKKCGKSVFDNYLRFLKTQNAAWIRDAEREM